MSFKFLDQANSSTYSNEKDAAQSFLDDKLSKNRYTINQQEELDSNGGSKDFRSEYNKTITNQAEIDAFNANPKGDYKTLSGDIDTKFKSGQWGHGSNSKEDLANKYGLDINAQANNGETAVWGTDRQGQRVFLGNASNDVRGNADVLKAHGAQADAGEVNHSNAGENEVSSNGDLIGAMLNLWDGGNADPGKAPKAIERLDKIEHSPEINQAQERVRAYENDVLSGKTSEDIYQTGSNEKYSFDAAKGAAGIGTPMNGDPAQPAIKATTSFLNNKKSEVKDKYQFQPQG